MRSKYVLIPFILVLIAAPVAFALATYLGGPSSGSNVTRALFAMTVIVEALALSQAIMARKLFSPPDPGRVTWTLIVAFLMVRLIASLRHASLIYGIVPKYDEGASGNLFFYAIVLRYLNTLSGLLLVAALITAVRTYRATGLKFLLTRRDELYILAVWAMVAVAVLLRSSLGLSDSAQADDHYIASYRLVSVFVGALIASLCVAIRRYVLQMRGGAVARVWNAVVIAGAARAASFVALALLSNWSASVAQFSEQYLIWIFVGCWLLASLYQQEVVPRTTGRLVGTAVGAVSP
jgi:hypothetical protein